MLLLLKGDLIFRVIGQVLVTVVKFNCKANKEVQEYTTKMESDYMRVW